MPYQAVPYQAVLCCTMPCCTKPCCTELCPTKLCCDVPAHVVLVGPSRLFWEVRCFPRQPHCRDPQEKWGALPPCKVALGTPESP